MARESITTGSTAGNKRRASTHYGRMLEEGTAPSEHNVSQDKFVQTLTFSYDNLPSESLDELYQRIPAGARVLSAKLAVTTAFAGGTSLAVGLNQPDGTVIDADGLVTDANAPLANLAAGDYVDGTGALVGSSDGLANDGCIVVAATGTFTAGEATLTVEYEKALDRNQAMNG